MDEKRYPNRRRKTVFEAQGFVSAPKVVHAAEAKAESLPNSSLAHVKLEPKIVDSDETEDDSDDDFTIPSFWSGLIKDEEEEEEDDVDDDDDNTPVSKNLPAAEVFSKPRRAPLMVKLEKKRKLAQIPSRSVIRNKTNVGTSRKRREPSRPVPKTSRSGSAFRLNPDKTAVVSSETAPSILRMKVDDAQVIAPPPPPPLPVRPVVQASKTDPRSVEAVIIDEQSSDPLHAIRNERIMHSVTIIELALIEGYKALKILESIFPGNDSAKVALETLTSTLKTLENRVISLEKNLGSTLVNILRSTSASTESPTPINTPWFMRQKALDEAESTWNSLQNEIFKASIASSITSASSSVVPSTSASSSSSSSSSSDSVPRIPSAASFFLGAGAAKNDIPKGLLTDDWLVSATEALTVGTSSESIRRPSPSILSGGGDPQSARNRHHTVILSARRDPNEGLVCPDIPSSALSVMQPNILQLPTDDSLLT